MTKINNYTSLPIFSLFFSIRSGNMDVFYIFSLLTFVNEVNTRSGADPSRGRRGHDPL